MSTFISPTKLNLIRQQGPPSPGEDLRKTFNQAMLEWHNSMDLSNVINMHMLQANKNVRVIWLPSSFGELNFEYEIGDYSRAGQGKKLKPGFTKAY